MQRALPSKHESQAKLVDSSSYRSPEDGKHCKKRSRRATILLLLGAFLALYFLLFFANPYQQVVSAIKESLYPSSSHQESQTKTEIKTETKNVTNKKNNDKDNNNNNNTNNEESMTNGTNHDTPKMGTFPQAHNKTKYHVIFSTSCSTFQDWQSYTFFFHALQSGQPGDVTRIASGCSPSDAKTLKDLFEKEIKPMAPNRFHLHLTPDFATSVIPDINYRYFNKPFGLRHWLQHGLGYPQAASEYDDTIILLLDPDQIIIRPITRDFSPNVVEVWRSRDGSRVPIFQSVQHGQPFAQQYGFNLQWKEKFNASDICNCTNSRVDTMDMAEAKAHYAVGPPYVATARDMYQIALKWTEFVPRIYDKYPYLLAEMFGYCFAAAHLNLPHRVAKSFMISHVATPGEDWTLVDNLPNETVCTKPHNDLVPHVIHYCQLYSLGEWYIGKYRLRKDFISCKAPLLMEPPPSIIENDYQIAVNGSRVGIKNTKQQPKRLAFMICQLIFRLNQAAIYYKQNHCPEGDANYEYNYTIHNNTIG